MRAAHGKGTLPVPLAFTGLIVARRGSECLRRGRVAAVSGPEVTATAHGLDFHWGGPSLHISGVGRWRMRRGRPFLNPPGALEVLFRWQGKDCASFGSPVGNQ